VTRYVPPIHTQRNEESPWDGCWAYSLATAIDAATGGRILVTEAQVRKASANRDRPGLSDGGNIDDQVKAIGILAPAVKFRTHPTAVELRDHLAAGGGAALSGYQADAPRGQRQYDPRFYDRNRFGTGHNVYWQGLDSVRAACLDPLIPAGAKAPVYQITDALHFAWGDVKKKIALLVTPVSLAPTPAPKVDRVRVSGSWWDYDISGSKAKGYHIGRVSRVTRGYSAPLAPRSTWVGTPEKPFIWGGQPRVFARVAAPSAYLGCWVDLTGAPNVIHLPAD
jgi:hypothetical protein